MSKAVKTDAQRDADKAERERLTQEARAKIEAAIESKVQAKMLETVMPNGKTVAENIEQQRAEVAHRQPGRWPIQIPMWVLEACARDAKNITEAAKSPSVKSLLKAFESPAMQGLAKLIKDNPRKNEAWLITHMKADEGLRDAAVETFVKNNASGLFLKLRPK